MKQNFFDHFYDLINIKAKSIDFNKLVEMANLIRNTKLNSGKIIIVGNGGSSAIASHVAIDLTKAANIRSINFNEASLLTCLSNDYGYESWVEKALDYYADNNDMVILISSSGQSKNIINGAKKAMNVNLKHLDDTKTSSIKAAYYKKSIKDKSKKILNRIKKLNG